MTRGYPRHWDWPIVQRYSTLRNRQIQRRRKREAVLAVYLFEDSVMSGVSFHGEGLEVGTLIKTFVDAPRRRNTALGWTLVKAAKVFA